MKIYLLKRDEADMTDLIRKTKADGYSLKILDDKCRLPVFYIRGVKAETANIMKQTALSVGCDCSVSRGVISGEKELSDMMVMCTDSQLFKMKDKLAGQPFSLEKTINEMIGRLSLANVFRAGGRNLLEGKRFLIMGILNLTDDSFYDGGKYNSIDEALKHTEKMIEEGAGIIDAGGESTRPGSSPVGEDEEKRRVIPFLREASKRFPETIFSVDTYKAGVAKEAFDAGASVVNDISGMRFDPQMPSAVAAKKASCILMHIKGEPKSMQESPEYGDVTLEVADYLVESAGIAEKSGIERECIAVDPGIGFGKKTEHNLTLIKNLNAIRSLGYPVCVGLSNKSFIGGILNRKKNERVFGTVGANVEAFRSGASIFRVHNVVENIEALKVAEEIRYAGN